MQRETFNRHRDCVRANIGCLFTVDAPTYPRDLQIPINLVLDSHSALVLVINLLNKAIYVPKQCHQFPLFRDVLGGVAPVLECAATLVRM